MIVALTGATGFVGQAILDEAGGGLTLRALTRREQAEREDVHWVRGDLSDAEALSSLCEKADAVLHVAGLTNGRDAADFERANVAGTENVIAAMKATKVKRLVLVSSLAAREPGLSLYGASRARAEERVAQSGLDWTIVRPPGVYGPRDVDYFEMFRSARVGFVPLPPSGASSILHVADLARLLLDLVDAPPALVRRKTFEPDDGREGGWSHRELAQAIGKAMGRKVFAPHLPKPALELAAKIDGLLRGDKARLTQDRVGYMAHPNWVARFDRRVPEAVWKPAITGSEGLSDTARWYRAQGWL